MNVVVPSLRTPPWARVASMQRSKATAVDRSKKLPMILPIPNDVAIVQDAPHISVTYYPLPQAPIPLRILVMGLASVLFAIFGARCLFTSVAMLAVGGEEREHSASSGDGRIETSCAIVEDARREKAMMGAEMLPGDWRCSCGNINYAFRKGCYRCGRERPKPQAKEVAEDEMSRGDWRCTCGCVNFARRGKCFACDLERPMELEIEMLPGDWKCKCGYVNYGAPKNCARCSALRKFPPKEIGANKMLPGDWKCSCGCINYARRKKCYACGLPPPGAAKEIIEDEMVPGDWKCGCGCVNFARRKRCYECGAQRPGSQELAADGMEPGDWRCSCGFVNFARRKNCHECGLSR